MAASLVQLADLRLHGVRECQRWPRGEGLHARGAPAVAAVQPDKLTATSSHDA